MGKLNYATGYGKQSVVFAFFDVAAGSEFGAALADDNRAGFGVFSLIEFDAEPLRLGVSA